jgi:hypothetical protein
MQNGVGGDATNASARRPSAFLPGVQNRWDGWGAQIRLVIGMRCKEGEVSRCFQWNRQPGEAEKPGEV